MLDYTNIIDNPFPNNFDSSGQWTPASYNDVKAAHRAKHENEAISNSDKAMAEMITSVLK